MTQNEPVALVPTKPDTEAAADARAKLTPLLEQVAAIMNDIERDGLRIGWQIGRDSFGRQRLLTIDVSRPL